MLDRRMFLALGMGSALQASYDGRVKIEPGKLWVPNWMPVPALLIETFNGKNKEQAEFYSKTKNLESLAFTIMCGSFLYKTENPLFSHVFLELGHGMHVPGMISATGRPELNYTLDLQVILDEMLRDIGLNVIIKNYDQPEVSDAGGEQNVLRRENRYQIERRIASIAQEEKEEVERLGLPKEAFVHYSLHVDSVAYEDEKKRLHIVREPRAPMIHVAKNPSKETMGHAQAMKVMLEHHYKIAREQYSQS